MPALTREVLINEIGARLDERLVVEDPQPYGDGFIVTNNGDGATLVFKAGGPYFSVVVEELKLTPTRAKKGKAS